MESATNGGTVFSALLSDDELVHRVKDLAACERRASVALIRSLAEFDARSLYLREGCSSLFTYCTHVLHLSEGSAYNRIETARAARRYPKILEALERGDLTLTAVRLLAPHLTPGNHVQLLAAARHRSKLEIQELIASLSPRPAAATIIRRVVPQPSINDPTTAAAAPQQSQPKLATTATSYIHTGVVTPLAPERYRLQVTLTRQTAEKLRRARALARHAIPDGDVGSILDRALTLLIDDLERRRCVRVASPRPQHSCERTSSGRHILAAVRRAVWQRDEGRCAFVGRTGRCHETAFLEFHHVAPYAAGGAATVDNIQLRCRGHNQYEARLFFGDMFVRERQTAYVFSNADRHLGLSEIRPHSFRNRRDSCAACVMARAAATESPPTSGAAAVIGGPARGD
jgi:5-methylcytosine-specific restriction endonuclease McrA